MRINAKKLDLIARIIEVDNEEILAKMKDVMNENRSSTGHWYEELPDEIKSSVDQGLIEAENGEGISHAEMMKSYSKYL